MTGRSDTERFLDAFLAPEGTELLSNRVLEAALSDVARTPQKRALRVPWRFPDIPVTYRAVAAAVALAVVVGAGGIVYLRSGGLIGGPNPTASPSPTAHPSPSTPPASPPPPPSIGGLDATFVSTRYGYSIDYPATWAAHPAAAEPGTINNLVIDPGGTSPFDALDCGPYPPGCGDPYVDFGEFFGIAARAPAGLTPEEWVAANHRPECPSDLGDTVKIDGRTAFVISGGCPGGLGPRWDYTVLLATDDLVYRFELVSPKNPDQRFFAMLSTIRVLATPAAS